MVRKLNQFIRPIWWDSNDNPTMKGHGMLCNDCVTGASRNILLRWYWDTSPWEHITALQLAL